MNNLQKMGFRTECAVVGDDYFQIDLVSDSLDVCLKWSWGDVEAPFFFIDDERDEGEAFSKFSDLFGAKTPASKWGNWDANSLLLNEAEDLALEYFQSRFK